MDAKTVGAVAALTGVSVRALHHYDHIGLVVPSVRTAAGYRGYTGADVERLHVVLVYRAAGLPLDEIGVLLDDPNVEVLERLRHQHALLNERIDRLQNTSKYWRNSWTHTAPEFSSPPKNRWRSSAPPRSPRSTPPRRRNAGVTPTPGASHSSGPRASPRRTGCRSRPRVTRWLAIWRRLSATAWSPDPCAPTSWPAATAPASSASTTA